MKVSAFFWRKFTHNILHESAIFVMEKSRFLTGSQTPKWVLEEYNYFCSNHDLTSRSLLYACIRLQRKPNNYFFEYYLCNGNYKWFLYSNSDHLLILLIQKNNTFISVTTFQQIFWPLKEFKIQKSKVEPRVLQSDGSTCFKPKFILQV